MNLDDVAPFPKMSPPVQDPLALTVACVMNGVELAEVVARLL
jgi:hypothetical protein